MNAYQQLYKILVTDCGFNPDMKLEYAGYYLTLNDYIQAVADRGGYQTILNNLKMVKLNGKRSVELYLKGVSTRIIMEYLNKNAHYYDYYQNVIKKSS